ncbi:U6 snRNA-associated Sm-like protein LSm7 [Pseudohyphozyma bogoriensis]|nr:U6 snRNA-associated Sm-like protein LSm7 [Pseudohyphozyma bogoriensis]
MNDSRVSTSRLARSAARSPLAQGRGRGRGGARGGASGARGGGAGPSGSSRDDKPRREAILDLSKYLDQRVRVKFTGGREVTGTLKGYDQLLNLVMDDIEELVRGPKK